MHNDHDIMRENIKTNSIGAVVESCNQYFPNSINGVHTERAYHGITRGFILNEIVNKCPFIINKKKNFEKAVKSKLTLL